MSEFIKPDNLNVVWASGGDRLFPGNTKYAAGWGVEIPPRQYFNEIDYKQDQMLAHVNQQGIASWDGGTEYQAGKSLTMGTDGIIYKCKTTHSNQNPVMDSGRVYWRVAFVDNPQDGKQVKGNNGHTDLGNGLINQWGTTGAISVATGPTQVSFNKPFSSFYNVVATAQSGSSVHITVETTSNTGFSYSAWNNSGQRVANVGVWWQALGEEV